MALFNIKSLSLSVLFILSTSSLAQVSQTVQPRQMASAVNDSSTHENNGIAYGTEYSRIIVTLGRTRIDKATAQQEYIDDNATSLRLGWEHASSAFIKGLGLNMYFYSDQAGFSQRVENVWSGKTSTQESDAAGIALYGEVGYAFPIADNVTLDMLGGIEIDISSERTIPNCTDCYEQDIDVSPGLYVTPRIRFHNSESVSFGLSYQYFISGDFNSTPMIWANFNF